MRSSPPASRASSSVPAIPNPVVDGRGIERIRAAGIEVEAPRRPRRAPPERGVARLEVARPSVRHLQGGDHPRRARLRSRPALGVGRRVAAPGARAPRALRTRSRSGWGRCGPTHRASTRAMSVPPGSLGDSPSVAARCRKGRSSSCAPARSTRSCARSRRRASSRCCWRAGRPSPRRSSPPVSSTSCSSSSRPSWPGTGRVSSATSRRRSSSSTSARSPRERTCSLEAYLREP